MIFGSITNGAANVEARNYSEVGTVQYLNHCGKGLTLVYTAGPGPGWAGGWFATKIISQTTLQPSTQPKMRQPFLPFVGRQTGRMYSVK